jgi:2-polyprenyl-6-methoxyphenol hydroxylase-like FAD-dependent oxidoreductase
MTDVLIVGGGIAGSALALMLGRRGFDVALFERDRFPREKPCGEGLMPAGVDVLKRLGLDAAVGGAPFYGVRYHSGEHIAEGRFPLCAGAIAEGRGQRRRHLDQLLFQAAAETPCVRALSGAPVESPVVENGRVTGALAAGSVERATLVIAADGAHSQMRQRLGLHQPCRRKRCGLRAHFQLASILEAHDRIDVFTGRGYELYVTPLPNRELLIAALAEADALELPIERTFHRWIRSHGALARRLEGARQISDLMCSSPLSGRARAGFRPGLILLGDAAACIDPITGGGMTHALLTAELLAEHIAVHWKSGGPWMESFARRRRALLWDYRVFTGMVLGLAGYPRLAEKFLMLLRYCPRAFSHLLGVAAGLEPLLPRMIHECPPKHR